MQESVEDLGKRRDELEAELSEVKQEIASRHGQVDDPSDRDVSIPVPGKDKSGPPPDPQPDPEVDPETGRAKGDKRRETDLPDGVGDSRETDSQPVQTATTPAQPQTATKPTGKTKQRQ